MGGRWNWLRAVSKGGHSSGGEPFREQGLSVCQCVSLLATVQPNCSRRRTVDHCTHTVSYYRDLGLNKTVSGFKDIKCRIHGFALCSFVFFCLLLDLNVNSAVCGLVLF
jgi:hypothetical protein